MQPSRNQADNDNDPADAIEYPRLGVKHPDGHLVGSGARIVARAEVGSGR